jgi:hypothetical protein
MEPWDPVGWSGPIDEMMHGHHPLSECVRLRFWQDTEPEGWWFYGDVSCGWGEWVVRAVGAEGALE